MSEKRDIFVEKMKAKLDEWNADIAKLEAQARQKEADVQEDYRQRIETLKSKHKSVEERLDKVGQTGGEAWKDLKTGLELAADSMGEALSSAQSRFR